MIHPSYEIDENLICHLCDFAIPVNIFRGVIDGNCNPLALQIDHVIPKAVGGTNDPSNLKPAHAFCNHSKSKFDWTAEKSNSAQIRVAILLKISLDEIWTLRPTDGICIFEDCEKVSRAGDFWQYCVIHARFMGENPRSTACNVINCEKQVRSKGDGHCTSHAKIAGLSPTITFCIVSDCQKQVQRKFSNKFCQSHCRERGLAHEVEPGVRDKAAHVARHSLTPSHGCYFCVEVDLTIEYFKLSQVDQDDKNLTLRKFGDKYRLSAKPAEHFTSLLKDAHIEETCRWCILLKSLNSKLFLLT